MTIAKSKTVALSGGRGRLAPAPAASIARIDKQLGRLLDINSGWRDPVTQQQLYDEYQHYLRYGSPWAPLALTPDESVHCDGYAIDTDDYDPKTVKLLNANGWVQTVYNPDGTLRERWHFEYVRARDKHAADPASTGSHPLEDDMVTKEDRAAIASSVVTALLGTKMSGGLDLSTGGNIGTQTVAVRLREIARRGYVTNEIVKQLAISAGITIDKLDGIRETLDTQLTADDVQTLVADLIGEAGTSGLSQTQIEAAVQAGVQKGIAGLQVTITPGQ